MTDHNTLPMQHADRRLTGKEYLEPLLLMNEYCTLAFYDEPYPYIVPMNQGYEWTEDGLILYLHMAPEGHRIDLIRKNPKVAVNICVWRDRRGYPAVKNENHDYRSITIFGTAEIIEGEKDPEAFLHGLNVFATQHGRKAILKYTKSLGDSMHILKVTAEQITGKAQYPIDSPEELVMPENPAE